MANYDHCSLQLDWREPGVDKDVRSYVPIFYGYTPIRFRIPFGGQLGRCSVSKIVPTCHMAITLGKGRLEVLLDKVAFDGGEIIKGAVMLYVKKAFECKDLDLFIHGSENMHWCIHRQGQDIGYYQTNELLNHKITLSTCHAFEPGEYEFPFSYQLPEKLPASFANYGEKAHFKDSVNLNPRVSYAVLAYLPVNKHLSSDLEATQSFALFTRVRDLPQGRFINAQVSSNVKLAAMINKGECSLSAKPDQHTYVTGDTVNVTVTINNSSGLKVSWLRMELGENFTFNHSEGQTRGTNWLRKTKASGAKAGETVERTLSIPLMMKSSGNPINPATPKSDSLCRSYRLVITCHFAFAKDVMMEIPIVVLPQARPADD